MKIKSHSSKIKNELALKKNEKVGLILKKKQIINSLANKITLL